MGSGFVAIAQLVMQEQERKRESKREDKRERRAKAAEARASMGETTATPVEQLSETARRNRRRRASGDRGLGPPTLGTPGLLGAQA